MVTKLDKLTKKSKEKDENAFSTNVESVSKRLNIRNPSSRIKSDRSNYDFISERSNNVYFKENPVKMVIDKIKRRAIFDSEFEFNKGEYGLHKKKFMKKRSFRSSKALIEKRRSVNFSSQCHAEGQAARNKVSKYISKKPKSFIFN